MREVIIDLDRYYPPEAKDPYMIQLYRRVTRCENCKYSNTFHEPIKGYDSLMCKWFSQNVWVVKVEPTGFCAWGEPKEGGFL